MPNLDSYSLRKNSIGSNASVPPISLSEYDNQTFNMLDESGTHDELHDLPHPPSSTTTYIKTLQRLTREALPHINLYRDIRSIHMESRPTLDELHQETTSIKVGNYIKYRYIHESI